MVDNGFDEGTGGRPVAFNMSAGWQSALGARPGQDSQRPGGVFSGRVPGFTTFHLELCTCIQFSTVWRTLRNERNQKTSLWLVAVAQIDEARAPRGEYNKAMGVYRCLRKCRSNHSLNVYFGEGTQTPPILHPKSGCGERGTYSN